MSSSVLVTGARAFCALDWIRRFGRAGHHVTACDSFQHPLCRGSRYLSRYVEVPPAHSSPVAYALAVRDVARECRAEWILPTCEEIFVLARYREVFEGTSKLLAAPFETLARLHHKGEFISLVASLPGQAIHAPETHEFNSRAGLKAFAETHGGLRDWVLKPVFSRFAAEVQIRPFQWQWRRIDPGPGRPWLAQRFAQGKPICTFTLAVEGRITAHSTYEPKHQVRRGAGFFFEPVESEELFTFCAALVKHLNFTGQICFDFIAGPDGIHVIECNPRATSGIHLLAERDPLPFLEGTSTGPWPVAPNPRMIAFAMFTERGRGLGRWRDFLRGEDVVKPADDRLTARGDWDMYRELRDRARALGKPRDLKGASSFDLEWNGSPFPELPEEMVLANRSR